MALKLYSYYRNSAGQRVRIALNLKQIPFEYIALKSLEAGEYVKINPQGLIPSLDIDGQIVVQSSAILEYIEERWPEPPLLRADPILRAQARAFAQIIACEMHPLNVHRVRQFLAGLMSVFEPRIGEWYGHWIDDGFRALETMLDRRGHAQQFCFGGQTGIRCPMPNPLPQAPRRFSHLGGRLLLPVWNHRVEQMLVVHGAFVGKCCIVAWRGCPTVAGPKSNGLAGGMIDQFSHAFGALAQALRRHGGTSSAPAR